ncbi:hypothetical protein F383_36519 [Gossypium arboreum]|nr:hypothetical protein F383_36519 [Gossypium arboreum]
MGPKSRH